MSQEELKRLRGDLRTNSDLKGEIKSLRKKASRDALITWAETKGYAINEGDFNSATSSQ